MLGGPRNLRHRCHVKVEPPYFGDPGSPYPYEYGDPVMILGTPLQTFWLLKINLIAEVQ